MYNHFTQAQQDRFDRVTAALDMDDTMAAMIRFKDAICACKDANCVKGVSDDMVEYSKVHAGKEARMTDAQNKLSTQIGTAMSACMTKAMGMATP